MAINNTAATGPLTADKHPDHHDLSLPALAGYLTPTNRSDSIRVGRHEWGRGGPMLLAGDRAEEVSCRRAEINDVLSDLCQLAS